MMNLVPLVALAFEPQPTRKSRSDKMRRLETQPSQPLAWLPVTSPTPAAPVVSSRRSSLNPETPAFEPLSPPHDGTSPPLPCTPSPLLDETKLLTSPARRRTLELPPSPPDSPPRELHEDFARPCPPPPTPSSSTSQLVYARPRNKACRGRAPTRSSDGSSRNRSTGAPRRPRAPTSSCRASTDDVVHHLPTPEPETIPELDEDASIVDEDEDDERFLSLPLLRLRHRLAVSLTLSNYSNLPRASASAPPSSPATTSPDLTRTLAALPADPSSNPPHRRRRAFPPGTVWAEHSHFHLYALQRSKADRTPGHIGYWKRWEGIDLD
ncbi:hypothetical protein JCM10212_007153 [Sporobolomyces blumeae]